MEQSYAESIEWGIAAAVTLAIWGAIVLVFTVLTRARDPEPQPAGLEFGGDESPAITNFLAHGWKLRNAAVSATLVDLAARDVVVFDEPATDRYTVQVLDRTATDLTPYEQQVLDMVASHGRDGSPVPFEALTTGHGADAGKWFGRFGKAVVAESRHRGLTQARWQPAHWLFVAVMALAPAVFAAAAIVALPDTSSTSSDSDESNPVVAFFGIAAIAWTGLMVVFRSIRAERDTDAGLAAAGRWMGLRENLQAGTFAEMEPTAVAIWDRYLAYAVALGVGHTTARAIPLGAESDTEAWSSVGGRWRLVRVSYARIGLAPGWGKRPWTVVVGGLLQLAAVAGVVYGIRQLTADGEVGSDLDIDPRIYAALAVAGGLIALRALVAVVVGGLDLGRHRVIEGRVLRVRQRDKVTRWAVDDGTSDEIRAFTGWGGRVRQGADVKVDVSPRLCFVRSVEVVQDETAAPEAAITPEPSAAARPDPAATTAAVGVLSRVDPSVVSAALGIPVQASETTTFPGGATRHFAGDGAGVVVTIAGPGMGAALYQQITTIPSFMRSEVAGLGDEATWILRHSLAVLAGENAVQVGIRAKGRDNDDRRNAATAIARAVLNLSRNPSPA